jgi:hypothetical protein
MTRVSVFVCDVTFDPSGMGGPTSSYTTAGIDLRIMWPRKPHHYMKVGIPPGWIVVNRSMKKQLQLTYSRHVCMSRVLPVTVAARSRAWTVFARSDARIVGLNPTQGMNVWCAYAFILCLCCPVFRQRPCDELITRPRTPTVCEKWLRNWIWGLGPEWTGRSIYKKKREWC